jgi:hypothetical protein
MFGKERLITDSVNEYRDCCRALWNRSFLQNFQRDANWSLVDSFNAIKNELFQSCVIIPTLGETADDFTLGYPSTRIRIKFSQHRGTTIKLNRNNNSLNNAEPNNAGYWDHPVTELDSTATVLFVNHFDWDPYGFLDMSLIVGEILAYPSHPELEGHRLLIESSHVDMVMLT